jgi:hypothetical protein
MAAMKPATILLGIRVRIFHMKDEFDSDCGAEVDPNRTCYKVTLVAIPTTARPLF